MKLGAIHKANEISEAARAFAMLCRSHLLSDGAASSALVFAEAHRYPERVQNVLANHELREGARFKLKTGVSALTTSEAAALTEHRLLTDAFLRSLGAAGAFDQIVDAMLPLPPKTRIAIVSQAITGDRPGEGEQKLISNLSLTADQYDESKAVGIIVLSNELIRLSGPLGARLFERELKRAIARIADARLITIATAGVTPNGASGVTADALRSDLQDAFDDIDSDDGAQFFIVMGSAVAKNIAFLNDAEDLVRDFTPTGGFIRGVPVVVSDQAGANIVVLDASQFGGDRGTVEVSRSTQATLSMDNNPDASPQQPSAVMTSLWQSNMVGLRAERLFGCVRLSSTAAAVISNASYLNS